MKPVSVDLKKLSDVVDKGVPKKLEYNTNKKSFREKIKDAENKIPDISRLVTDTVFNKK